MKVVADTSILIDFLRSKLPEKSIFYQLNMENNLTISLITVAELFSGNSAQTKTGKEKLNYLLGGIEIRIPDMEDAVRAGEIRHKHQLSITDALVASLALKLNLPLATLDQKAFKRIKNLELYPIRQ
ncbi:hypothetical protein A2W14_05595 [Candidatus Gottesmanbacteria bacterium RBG_16_37_8]|uniref:PIN domain-containing protein n=1 Tax=Candidatus Gottesmanbacteria bacterium RBG_16_37_8 TaxID=1798371 RepID=A0A1F5YUY2_9BACT|nr:MAG: hypothetical protein A2W14_05595 [Candidatus Gottesmanbacteria bacterium RBG_16_37_8]